MGVSAGTAEDSVGEKLKVISRAVAIRHGSEGMLWALNQAAFGEESPPRRASAFDGPSAVAAPSRPRQQKRGGCTCGESTPPDDLQAREAAAADSSPPWLT